MNILTKLTDWERLNELSSTESDIARRIVFSNVIFVSLPLVYFIFMIIDYESYMEPIRELNFDNLVVPGIIIICLFCRWLNTIQLTTLSRLLFLVTWPLLLHVIPIVLQGTPDDYYLAFPFGIVFHTLMVQLMISYRKETFLFVLLMVINFGAAVMSGYFLNYHAPADTPLRELGGNIYYVLVTILYWLLFNLTMFFVIYLIEMFIQRVNAARLKIESQHRETEQQKMEIDKINLRLERSVNERTMQLREQNQKLRDYAFYNAHLLRAPFSKIKGLLNLRDMAISKDEPSETHAEIDDKLRHSLNELEGIIQDIQDIIKEDRG